MAIFHDFLLIFVPLFVVIDPAGTIPLYLGITARYEESERRRIALRAFTAASVTGILFVILGQAVLRFMGVKIEDFQIAGGILVFILAVIDLLIPGKPAVKDEAVNPSDSLGIVPLAMPLIIGPATMTTTLLLVNTYTDAYNREFGSPMGQIVVIMMVCLALLLNLTILLVGMWHSYRLVALVGKNTLLVVTKIVMVLLATYAVSLIHQGIVSIVHGR